MIVTCVVFPLVVIASLFTATMILVSFLLLHNGYRLLVVIVIVVFLLYSSGLLVMIAMAFAVAIAAIIVVSLHVLRGC